MAATNAEIALKVAHLGGLDAAWVNSRRSGWFLANKICAVLIASGFSVLTASLKPDLLNYKKTHPESGNTNQYNFIYWLLFIYYSFTALDQLIELYAVYFEREKGALGLLLEMNNFLGLSLIGYLTVFVNKSSSDVPEEY